MNSKRRRQVDISSQGAEKQVKLPVMLPVSLPPGYVLHIIARAILLVVLCPHSHSGPIRHSPTIGFFSFSYYGIVHMFQRPFLDQPCGGLGPADWSHLHKKGQLLVLSVFMVTLVTGSLHSPLRV
jgi:hypothetical protein